MLHTLSIFLMGTIFWLLVLDKYPFNQKGFDVLYPLKKKYEVYLKVGGTVLIIYSILLVIPL